MAGTSAQTALTLPETLTFAGLGLLGILFALCVLSTFLASAFADRARKIGYEVEPGCRPIALFWIGWPATFNLLESEARLARRDRTLRRLYALVLWLNRAVLVGLMLVIVMAVAARVLDRL